MDTLRLDLYQKSIEVIRAGQASSGAYVASPTFSQYGFSWLRDGTWIAYAMNCANEHDSAAAFYEWVAATLLRQKPRLQHLLGKLAQNQSLAEKDYLPTRFTLAGEVEEGGSWWDFQLDGYGTWLWGLVEYLKSTDTTLTEAMRSAVQMTVSYLAVLWQSPNYDCWEEHRHHIHPATLASIYGGLRAIQQFDPALVPPGLPEAIQQYTRDYLLAPAGHLMKFDGNEEVDASLLWATVPNRLVDLHDPVFTKTLAKIEQDLHYPSGGVYRYKADTYFGGGEWLLLTAWLGWVYVELGQVEKAQLLLYWIEQQATPEGYLPEQVSDHLLDSSRYAEWEAKWGTVATPLLWSHAMYLILKTKLEHKK